MSGSSRSTSATVGTNSMARARAVAPVYATRASPYPVDRSNDARAPAALTSSSTTNMRAISPRASPVPCAADCVDGCALTTVRSAKTHGPRVLVTRFEALDLPFGFVARDAIGLLNLARKPRPSPRNHIEVSVGELCPVCVHLAPESLPARFHQIPIH